MLNSESNVNSINRRVVAYVAADNHEANLLAIQLNAHGIPATAVEDHSGVGDFAFGQTGLVRPRVWVRQADLDEATIILQEYELERADQNQRRLDSEMTWKMIDCLCESCGETTQFPEELKGNVEMCPKCGDFLDVGDVDWNEEDYAEQPEESDSSEEE